MKDQKKLIIDKSSEKIMKLIIKIKDEVGIKSVTFDNGLEFAFHKLLNDVGIDTFFSKPYSPRARCPLRVKRVIENLNKIIRRFYPKGTIFDNISHQKIKSICCIIANTLREILGFKSPNQVHFQ